MPSSTSQQSDQIAVQVFTPTITNTLILAQLPNETFSPEGIDEIKRKLTSQGGELTAFAALKSFGRIIAVFKETLQSLKARLTLEDDKSYNGRVYFGDHVFVDGEKSVAGSKPTGPFPSYLEVPGNERNFLISPPGSPPIGWVQVEEAGPNPNPHAQDIIQALRELQDDPLSLDGPEELNSPVEDGESEPDTFVPTESSTPGGPNIPFSLSIPLRAPDQDHGLDSPIMIKVENWDQPEHHLLTAQETREQEERNVEFQRQIHQDQQRWVQQHLPRTPRPPMS